ncbi:ATP-binding protein [Oceanobacillus salinisoli]|uniref:ATP-binding protein n=1 Tax=Oceanobacillus salinisoli TaxID=2678611 RepID=UPI0018CC77AE|nr:ATP-binding protein [Oceanobacillus salinisoli]
MDYCNDCPSNKDCTNCLELIGGGRFRKKVNPPINVKLQSLDGGGSYSGKLHAISRVGMLIETDAPKKEYKISINGKINAHLSPVYHKGLEHLIAFDIVIVNREEKSDKRLTRDEYEYLFMEKTEIIDNLTEDLEEEVKTRIREDLKTELFKSQLLDELMVGSTYKYEKGHLKQLSGEKSPLLDEETLTDLMQKSFKEKGPTRDVIIDPDGRYIDVHAVPFGYQTGGCLTFDVTDLVNKEKRLLQEQWENYKEVIQSITKGKVLLKNSTEMDELLQEYQEKERYQLTDKKQLTPIRESIKEVINNYNLTDKQQYGILLAVQEAATNALKYSTDGEIQLRESDDEILITVHDQGKGIALKNLPKALLVNGFSTGSTLGQGFNLMSRISHRLFLKSDHTGTSVGLLFKKP